VARDGEPDPVPIMTAQAFRSSLSTPGSAEQVGIFAGAPLCVVELDDPRDTGTDLGPLARSLPCVVVGLARGSTGGRRPPGMDLLLTDDPNAAAPWVASDDLAAVLDNLAVACGDSPLAALSLAQLLRYSPQLSVADALVAESFVYATLQSGPEHRAWLDGRSPGAGPRGGGSAGAGRGSEPVSVTRAGDVLSILLDRPEVHNAYSSAMRDALTAALQVAVADPTVSQVRVAGSGPSFCSGGDLAEFGTAPDPATAHGVRTARGAAIWVHRCGPRVRAHVHGACIGAGVELAAFAGHVVADRATRFRLPEVAMGLVPGAGGTVSLPRRIGRQRTLYLALSGVELDAVTAAGWGLVDEIVPRDPASPP
jgi:enoyl-CoA hydratase/carnithine racemase